MKMNYVRLLVSDFTACFNFYAETLGLAVTWGKADDVYASFATGGDTGVAIFSRKLMLESLRWEGQDTVGVPQQVLCFAVNDIDAECSRLRHAGVHFINEPQDYPGWGIRCAHFADPEGNIIEINKELPQDKWAEDLLADMPENYE